MTTHQANNLVNYLQGQQSAMIHLLQEIVMAESPSTVKRAQDPTFRILSKALARIGYQPHRMVGQDTGGYIYASPKTRNRNQPIQLLLGHCDTVWPLNTLSAMPVQIQGEKMSGPGVYDMKAGLVQLIFALQAIVDLSLECKVTPIVLINSDEEIGSHESTPMIRRLARIADRALILEPSLGLSGKLKTARKGVGRFTIVVRGKAAHAGLEPTKGASAIVALSHTIQELFRMNDPDRGISVNVGMIEGGIRPNVIAPESRAVVDVRVSTQKDAVRITRKIKNLKPVTPEVTIEVEGRIGRPPMELTPRNQQLWALARSAGNVLGIELEGAMAGGGSDANTTSQFTATLDGLGAIGDGAHAKHEFVYVDKMTERTALLALILMEKPIRTEQKKIQK